VVCTDGGCHDSRGPQPQNRWPQRRLPFADAIFDLVLVSSVSFCPREISRVLKSGGTLLTWQAGTGKDGPELVDLLEGTPPEWSLPENRWDIDATLAEAGLLTGEQLAYQGSSTYRDIGAVVYYLKAVPWAITDFDVDRYRERLYKLHLRMKAEGGLTLIGVHRLFEVRKP
jgi:SAM-dependent methyltransferase